MSKYKNKEFINPIEKKIDEAFRKHSKFYTLCHDHPVKAIFFMIVSSIVFVALIVFIIILIASLWNFVQRT
jgi:hypothetical protein